MRWAIVGTGAISADFARSLRDAKHGVLHAVGSRNRDRAAEFASRWDASVFGVTEAILARDDVDAVYVGTVHTAHEDVATAALRHGKAVLCEKPLTQDPRATRRLIAAAEVAGMPLLEAYKYRFGPLAERFRELLESGGIGTPATLRAGFGFAAATRTGRLFDPTVGGGAILDVGGYPVSLLVGVAAWAGFDLADARIESVRGTVAEDGVDEDAVARIRIEGLTAEVETSIVADLPRTVTIQGDRGRMEIVNIWGSRVASGSRIVLHRDGKRDVIDVPSIQPMAAEADAIARVLADGCCEVPEMPWRHSLVTADLLGQWRAMLAAP